MAHSAHWQITEKKAYTLFSSPYLLGEEIFVICSFFQWKSFLFRAEGNKNQDTKHQHWTLHWVQIHWGSVIRLRSFQTTLAPSTTKHTPCLQVGDHATITPCATKGCHPPRKKGWRGLHDLLRVRQSLYQQDCKTYAGENQRAHFLQRVRPPLSQSIQTILDTACSGTGYFIDWLYLCLLIVFPIPTHAGWKR